MAEHPSTAELLKARVEHIAALAADKARREAEERGEPVAETLFEEKGRDE